MLATRSRPCATALRIAIVAALGAACAGPGGDIPWWGARAGAGSQAPEAELDPSVYTRAGSERADYLEREVSRLRADLRQAEEAMVAIESGLRGTHTRADAVSAIAEGRIAVERASRSVPWRPERLQEARGKLEEAERQLQAEHPGSAVFFASRARRIGETLSDEASVVERSSAARFVRSARVNLRAGPSTSHPVLEILREETPVFAEHRDGHWTLVRTLSGRLGWVHSSLLRTR